VPLRQQVLALHKEVLQWRLDSAYNAPLELAECHENIAVWELFLWIPWVRKFTATPNYLILPPEPIDFLQEGWR